MKRLMVLLFLTGCITTFSDDMLPETNKPNPKYKVGQCFNVFDPETGNVNPKDIVRVEAIGEGRYYYRWWTYLNEWALDTNTGIGVFEVFERMTKEVKCPTKSK